MAAERTLTGDILNTTVIKDNLLNEIQMMMMMETMEMIVIEMMMPQAKMDTPCQLETAHRGLLQKSLPRSPEQNSPLCIQISSIGMEKT